MALTLKSLLQQVEILAGERLDTPVAGLHYDSRQVKPGFIFVCIKGFWTDGHFYISEAADRGAVGVVVARNVSIPSNFAWARVENTRRALACMSTNFYGHPSRELSLIGVTGTNGKTTTAHLIEAVLQAKGWKMGVIGTVWNKIAEKKIPVTHTTPESLDLQFLLREMVSVGVGATVMEVSSHGLALERVTKCEFDVGVFTNLTQDHLDFHKSFKNYLAAKMLLFTGLGKNRTKKRPCYAVINLDDPAGKEIIKNVNVPVITYGIRAKADVKAENVDLFPTSISFNLTSQKEKIPFFLSLPGEFNVYNSLAAIAIGLQEGMALSALQDVLGNVRGVPGRFELVDGGQDFTVVVDYAHTPDGLENVLHTARTLTKGRVIAVFGCGGDRDPGKRPVMGKISGELSDFTFITSDNPRTEDPYQIMAQIEEGIKQVAGARYVLIENRYEAIRSALHFARREDFVIIAGKGHEGYQVLRDRIVPFNDRQVVLEILEKEIV